MKVIAVSLCSVIALCVCSMVFCADEEREASARRPLILLTNDDGIESAGIKALMKELPREADVFVVAPATNKSGVSQSLTYRGDIKVFKREVPEELKDLERKPLALYAVEGTPATCVLLGAGNLSKGRSIDMVVSGINPGSNIG